MPSCFCFPFKKKAVILSPPSVGIIKKYRHKIALDIDGTLLNSTTQFSTGCNMSLSCDTSSGLKIYYVFLRPYAREFIIYISQFYDVYIYSASNKHV